MYATFILSALLASTFALPTPSTPGGQDGVWEPAADSTTLCDSSTDLSVSFFVGPQKGSVLEAACQALGGSVCFYNAPNGTVCTQSLYELDKTKTSTQSVNVEKDGNKTPGYAAQFTVTPPPSNSSTVFWTGADCYGYFNDLVTNLSPDGCFNSVGSGPGNVTVGGTGALKGAVFDFKIVPTK